MDEIVKKLGHGVRLKIGALADGYAAEFDREDLDETDLCSLAAAWRDDLYALGEEIVETATRATGDSTDPDLCVYGCRLIHHWFDRWRGCFVNVRQRNELREFAGDVFEAAVFKYGLEAEADRKFEGAA